MKKNKKQINKENAERELEELDALGFEVLKFTEWHWRIINSDYKDFKLDVWPTRNKLMSQKDYKPKIYTSLAYDVDYIFKNECLK